jgi:polyribonucleotide nucleotidyltransferase
MDLKVAGTGAGVTACQADVHCGGVALGIVREAIIAAVAGYGTVLAAMVQAIPKPRAIPKPNAPVTGPARTHANTHSTHEQTWTFIHSLTH